VVGMEVTGIDVDELLDVVGAFAVDLLQLVHQLLLNLKGLEQLNSIGKFNSLDT